MQTIGHDGIDPRTFGNVLGLHLCGFLRDFKFAPVNIAARIDDLEQIAAMRGKEIDVEIRRQIVRRGAKPFGRFLDGTGGRAIFERGIGVPASGTYREIFNSDSAYYGGSNTGNLGSIASVQMTWMGFADSIAITLPPLAGVVFALADSGHAR